MSGSHGEDLPALPRLAGCEGRLVHRGTALAGVAALATGVGILLLGLRARDSWHDLQRAADPGGFVPVMQESVKGLFVHVTAPPPGEPFAGCGVVEALALETRRRYNLAADCQRGIRQVAMSNSARLLAYTRIAYDLSPALRQMLTPPRAEEAVVVEVGIGEGRVVAGTWPAMAVGFSPDERYLEIQGFPVEPSSTVAHYSVDLRTGAEELLPPGVLSPDWTTTFTPSQGGLTVWRVGSWQRTFLPLGSDRDAGRAAWSPDSSSVAVPVRKGPSRLMCGLELVAVPTGDSRKLVDMCDEVGQDFVTTAWSPDGRWIAFRAPADLAPGAPYRYHAPLYLLDVESGGLKLLIPHVMCCPLWSPDSRQMMFSSSYPPEPLSSEEGPYVVAVPEGRVRALNEKISPWLDKLWIRRLPWMASEP